jgi:hypothetical protein
MALNVGDLYATIRCDTSQFNAALNNAKQTMTSTVTDMNKITPSVSFPGGSSGGAPPMVHPLVKPLTDSMSADDMKEALTLVKDLSKGIADLARRFLQGGLQAAGMSNGLASLTSGLAVKLGIWGIAAAAVTGLVVGLYKFGKAALTAAASYEYAMAKIQGKDVSKTLVGQWQAFREKVNLVMVGIGQVIMPIFKPIVAFMNRAADRWLQFFAVVRAGMMQLRPALNEIKQAFAPIGKELGKFGTGAFRTALGFIASAFKGLSFTLSKIVPLFRIMTRVMMSGFIAVQWVMQSILDTIQKITGSGGMSLMEMLNRLAQLSIQKGWIVSAEAAARAKDAAKEAAQAALDHAQSVLNIAEANREARVEAEKARMAQIGWMGVAELYQRAQAAGQRAYARPGGLAPMSAQNAPNARELHSISSELKRQTKQSEDLLILVRDRLGVYA